MFIRHISVRIVEGESEMEEEINLKEIFDILKKHLALIFMSTFLGLAIAGGVTYFLITPKYASEAQLVVALPQTETSSVNDINFNLQMLNTYKDIILKGTAQAKEVQARLATDYQIDMTPGEIKASLQVIQAQNSQMFSIQATSEDSMVAEAIANTTATVFQDTIKDVLPNVERITIVSEASANPHPISPNNKLNLLIGLLLGSMIGVGLAFVLELFDRTIKDSRFVAENLELTLLGAIPTMNEKEINQEEIDRYFVAKATKTEIDFENNLRRSRRV